MAKGVKAVVVFFHLHLFQIVGKMAREVFLGAVVVGQLAHGPFGQIPEQTFMPQFAHFFHVVQKTQFDEERMNWDKTDAGGGLGVLDVHEDHTVIGLDVLDLQ